MIQVSTQLSVLLNTTLLKLLENLAITARRRVMIAPTRAAALLPVVVTTLHSASFDPTQTALTARQPSLKLTVLTHTTIDMWDDPF
jgi:hypothetical protein